MPPKFGTSGLRGLVSELTEARVSDHVKAFIASCELGGEIWIGEDLRPSSPVIADMVEAAALAEGIDVVRAGAVPTPALALAALAAKSGAIMITGSHIPADRNGLKFYTTSGEITKADEARIGAALGQAQSASSKGMVRRAAEVGDAYVSRYVAAYGDVLCGKRVGLYAHSSVGRDLLREILQGCGAEVLELGRSETFIPVDTEAVSDETRAALAGWASEHDLDAIVSTDGDADRPLLADEAGRVVPGDVLGQITCASLGAETVVTPISSNSAVTEKGFGAVLRTRIGSPYVIAGMEEAGGRVCGYEANGGFLLGFEAVGPGGSISPLATRDAVLPILAVLAQAGCEKVSALVAREPSRFTAADRLQELPEAAMRALVAELAKSRTARSDFLGHLGADEAACDLTDGVRMTTTDDRVFHVRPSGNAPELRLYVEAGEQGLLAEALARGLGLLQSRLQNVEI
ncbi:MAG: phosphomannomutase [Rhodobacterales bacterium]|nr:MAG: phosphomannomutase [Rhodobacterales bacterium]